MKKQLLVATFLLLGASAAHGQPGNAQAEARAFFDIGAKAYKAGNYADAIQGFTQAYERAQRPGLAFSLGQAHRMEYFSKGKPENLRQAVKYYREYLQKDPNGPRKGEVQEALEKLVPQLDRLGGEALPAETGGEPTQKKPRVMISTQTPGAEILFGGRKVGDYFVSEVQPGKYKFSVSAPGYETETREINVDASRELPPFSIALKEKPAFIVVRAPEGASVSIDGRLQGQAPLPPLEVKPGAHFVAVTMNGREAFTRELEVTRGESAKLDAELDTTTQRKTSWILMGVGVGGLIAGGVLGYMALDRESQATDIRDAADGAGNLPPSELGRYESLRSERDDFRLAALITGGAGLAVGATGLVLHIFDEPKVKAPELRERPRTQPGAPAPGAPKMELSAVPLLAPGFGGAGLHGRF